MNEKVPLSVLLEKAKGKFFQAFNQVIDETRLPAYLCEGIVLELLADIRNRKNFELISDIEIMGAGKSDTKEGE